MPAKKSPPTAKKKSAAKPIEGPDPRFEPVARALAGTAGFSLMEGKSGALRGLMLDGKSFGMSTHGRFVLKLDEERVAALVARGDGQPFEASAGRAMKGWIEITGAKSNWVALAKEAHRLAAAAGKSGKKSAAKKAAPKKPAAKPSAQEASQKLSTQATLNSGALSLMSWPAPARPLVGFAHHGSSTW